MKRPQARQVHRHPLRRDRLRIVELEGIHRDHLRQGGVDADGRAAEHPVGEHGGEGQCWRRVRSVRVLGEHRLGLGDAGQQTGRPPVFDQRHRLAVRGRHRDEQPPLIVVGAGHDWHFVDLAPGKGVLQGQGQQGRLVDRRPHQVADRSQPRYSGLEQRTDVGLSQAVQVVRGAAELADVLQVACLGLGLGDGVAGTGAQPALDDRFPEQPGADGRGQMGTHAHAPCGLPGDGHGGRVTAEGRDVDLHPLQGGLLVEQAIVAGRPAALSGQGGQGQEAQCPQAVIERDHHHTVLPGEAAGVVVAAGTQGEGPAVNPDHHREPAASRSCLGCVDVQVQAVLTADHLAGRLPGDGELRLDDLWTAIAGPAGVQR